MPTVYLLRHAERTNDYTFHANLSDIGFNRAYNILPQQLASLNLQAIYSSPFRRCLQTIVPFAQSSHLLINVEAALAENTPLAPEDYFMPYINVHYHSVIPFSNKYGKTFEQLKQELSLFITTISHQQTVLLVTHRPNINAFYSLLGTPNKFKSEQPMGIIQGPFYI